MISVYECKSLKEFLSCLKGEGIHHVKRRGTTTVVNSWVKGRNILTATKWGIDLIYSCEVDGQVPIESRLELEGYNVSTGQWTPENIKELRAIFKKKGNI